MKDSRVNVTLWTLTILAFATLLCLFGPDQAVCLAKKWLGEKAANFVIIVVVAILSACFFCYLLFVLSKARSAKKQ